MRVNFIGKLFDPNVGLNHFRKADVYGYIHAKGMVRHKNGITIGPWFTIYLNDGSQFDLKKIAQISKADVVVEGIIAFIREYKGTASILLRTDSRKAVEHLATPIASLKRWNLKVDQSFRWEFEKHRHIVGVVYERRSVVSCGVKDFRAIAKAKKE